MKKIGRIGLLGLSLILASRFATLPVVGEPRTFDQHASLALVGARVYPSPWAQPIFNGVVLIRDGKIAAVGRKGSIKIPDDAEVIDCTGMTLLSGFWNSHVHFTERKWENAASLPSSQLTGQLREMFTRYGVTTVFDTGSYWEITKVIRQRIES